MSIDDDSITCRGQQHSTPPTNDYTPVSVGTGTGSPPAKASATLARCKNSLLHPTNQKSEHICGAAVELLARGDGHAVSHQTLDRLLAFPTGSTFYYFRTRHALLLATIGYLTACSRDAFELASPE